MFNIYNVTISRAEGSHPAVILLPVVILSRLGSGAVHFDNLANLGYVDELVYQTLTVDLGQNAALVVISEKRLQSVN